MNMKQPDWTDAIQKYLDGDLAAADSRALLEEAARNSAVAEQLRLAKAVHAQLGRNVLENPGGSFTARVLSRLEEMPASVRTSPRNGLLLLMGILAACTVLVLMLGNDQLATGMIELNTARIPLRKFAPRISLELKTILNALILINLLLGFILLDRTVLRPYFERRTS
jgi:anti-sigma factor RsiW